MQYMRFASSVDITNNKPELMISILNSLKLLLMGQVLPLTGSSRGKQTVHRHNEIMTKL